MNKRLFAGFRIIPGPTLKTAYLALRTELGQEKIRWVEEENLHITLWFFGETDMRRLPEITAVLERAGEGILPFTVTVRGCGTFGRRKNPSVIWFGLEIPDTLAQLYQQVATLVATPGYTAEDRDYTPHLTLGRMKEIRDPERLHAITGTFADAEFHQQQLAGFALFESILRPQGPIYKELRFFPFENLTP